MQLEVGSIVEGRVTGVTKFGAFVELPDGSTGMVHISEVAAAYVKEISEHLKVNDVVKVKVLTVGDDKKISLSIKKAIEKRSFKTQPSNKSNGVPEVFEWNQKKQDNLSFEDMMLKFKQSSEEKMSELKKNEKRDYSRRGSAR